MKNNQHRPLRMPDPGLHFQQGVVLITSLILLLVMTMIGVSALNGSTLEERMSANDMFYTKSFQAAESAVEVAIADTGKLIEALNGGSVTVTVTLPDPSITTSEAEVTFMTKGPALGYAMGDEAGFANYFFDIEGTGKIDVVQARSETAHGIYVLGPN